MQGPKIPWRPGRIDGFSKDVTPDGRLPDASQGSDHLRNASRMNVPLRQYADGYRCRFSIAWGKLHPGFDFGHALKIYSQIQRPGNRCTLRCSRARPLPHRSVRSLNNRILPPRAHAVFRSSGFEGPWTFSPTTFTNDYYTLLFNEKCAPPSSSLCVPS